MARKAASPAKQKRGTSLSSLLLKNRSHRAFDRSFVVREDQLRSIVEVNRLTPSARNRQPLRFRAVLSDEADLVTPHIRLGAALPDLHLPTEESRPNAYIIICSTVPEDRYVAIDLGISAQSMLLRAVEMGLGGICIAAFDRTAIKEALSLELEPLMILAIGRGADRIELKSITEEESRDYYREGGIHYVPKLELDTLLIHPKEQK